MGYEYTKEIAELYVEIRQKFVEADILIFDAKSHCNRIDMHTYIFIGEDYDVNLEDLLIAIGVTPQMLRPVFNPQTEPVPRNFPFNFSWGGLNRHTLKYAEVELPLEIKDYEDLGAFPRSHKNFLELSKILHKPIKVLEVDPYTIKIQDHRPLFIAYPSGKIKEL